MVEVIDLRTPGLVEKAMMPEGDRQTGKKTRVEGKRAKAEQMGSWGQSGICPCKISEAEQFWAQSLALGI